MLILFFLTSNIRNLFILLSNRLLLPLPVSLQQLNIVFPQIINLFLVLPLHCLHRLPVIIMQTFYISLVLSLQSLQYIGVLSLQALYECFVR